MTTIAAAEGRGLGQRRLRRPADDRVRRGTGRTCRPTSSASILGPNFVLSFQETPGDCFDPVRERIRGGKGRIRKLGPDYLAYALIDAVVDNYFVVLEKLGERIDVLEEELVDRAHAGSSSTRSTA